MKRGGMERKGQFYIIAALIIISVVIGIVAVGNYVRTKPKFTKIYDLGKELEIETGEVISNGIYNEKNSNALNSLIKEWSQKYYEYSATQGFSGNWIFVYGDEKDITALVFSNNTAGEVSISIGGVVHGIEIPTTGIAEESYKPEGEEVTIIFQEVPYDFTLKEGQNFFFVIKSGEYGVS